MMKKEVIGFIGTGVMGQSMCKNLLKAGYKLNVFNRTKSKAEEIIKQGARWFETPKELAQNSDVIITIVGFPKDVENVILGEEGVLSGAKENSIIIDMTTSSPDLAKRIYEKASQKGVKSIDAPVSGGDLGAREATLAIMVGGDDSVFNEVLPILKVLGKNINLMGNAGAGQHTKMSNQILIAGTMIGVVESLLYAQKFGLDLDEVINVIGSGAAASWSINNLGRRIVKGDFNPGFFIKHYVKDMGIALEEAKKANLSLPGLALVNQFYVSAMAMGLENLGTQALYKVLESMNKNCA
jgi:3-hydroxyisobutyrate dehydrogenase